MEKGGSPREVAEEFYEAIAAGDIERFKAALITADREKMERARGTSPEFWWESECRYAEVYGVTWEFHGVRAETDDKVILRFKRPNADGTQRGSPVPIHLVRDEGERRIGTASV